MPYANVIVFVHFYAIFKKNYSPVRQTKTTMAPRAQFSALLLLWCMHLTLTTGNVGNKEHKHFGTGRSMPIQPVSLPVASPIKNVNTNTQTQDYGSGRQREFVGDTCKLRNNIKDTIDSRDGNFQELKFIIQDSMRPPKYEVKKRPVHNSRHNTCPSACRCGLDKDKEVTNVDCSDRGLTSIPKLPDTSIEVSLRNNDIRSVPCHVLSHLSRLQTLDLSRNTIEELYNCSFYGLSSLQELNFGNNEIKFLASGVFDPVHELHSLGLSHNKLTALDNQPFACLGQLKSLDISNNGLAHIQNETFLGLTSLTFLSLQSNHLLYDSSTFQPEAFAHLSSLLTLKLQGNQPYFSENFTYPDGVLSRLKDLRYLALDAYSYPLGHGFGFLKKLTHLNLHDTDSYCNLSQVPSDFFASISTTQPLDILLDHCNIIDPIPRDTFEHVPMINGLYLSDNRMGFDAFESLSYGLRNSNITFLDISRINKLDDENDNIKDTTFKYLKHTKLRRLSVEHSLIETVSERAIADLPRSLEYLSFYDNLIVRSTFLYGFLGLTNIKVLVGSKQVHYGRIDTLIPDTTKSDLVVKAKPIDPGLANLKLRQRELINLTLLPASRPATGSDAGVDDFCSSSDLSRTEILKTKEYILPLPKSLEEFYMSDANIKFNLPIVTFVNNEVLKIFDFSKNVFNCLGGPLRGVPNLEYLDLSGSSCFLMSTFMFSELPSLKTLLLYDNWLGQSIADDVDGLTFSKLAMLEKLDIHRNGIRTLAAGSFILNANLRTLNLSANELTYFRPTLANNTELTTLDLSFNILRGFTEANCREFVKLKTRNSAFQVYMADNSFVCECENLPFFRMLLEEPEIFADIEHFQCKFSNGSSLDYSKLEYFLPMLGSQCLAQSIFPVVLITFALLLVAFGVAFVYYYKRWQWKYLYYMARWRLHVDAIDFRDTPHKRVYITYDQEHLFYRALVHDEFLPHLQQNDIPFVHGEVDFPGRPTAASIAGAITNTAKTLVVLNSSIFEEPERIAEFNLAVMHELHISKEILVPVLHFGRRTVAHPRRNTDPDMPWAHHREAAAAEQAEFYTIHGDDAWSQDLGFGFLPHCFTEEVWDLVCDLLDSFPPEISCYLYGQIHRCLIYDGGSQQFWECLRQALLSEA